MASNPCVGRLFFASVRGFCPQKTMVSWVAGHMLMPMHCTCRGRRRCRSARSPGGFSHPVITPEHPIRAVGSLVSDSPPRGVKCPTAPCGFGGPFYKGAILTWGPKIRAGYCRDRGKSHGEQSDKSMNSGNLAAFTINLQCANPRLCQETTKFLSIDVVLNWAPCFFSGLFARNLNPKLQSQNPNFYKNPFPRILKPSPMIKTSAPRNVVVAAPQLKGN